MKLRLLWGRQPLAPLGTLTVLALIGQAPATLSLMAVAGLIIQPLLILAVISVVVAALVAIGLRPAPLLGALFCGSTMIGGLVSQPYLLYHLTHPVEIGFFMTALLMYVFGVIAVCAGVGATIQNYRGSTRKAPSWLATPLMGLVGFVLGAFLVSVLVATSAQPASATPGANGTPAVHLGVSNFEQSSVTISKGSKLLLIDDGHFPHILQNGSWDNNSPHPSREPGAPIVQDVDVNGNSVEIGPFNTAGTFHLYCTIHPGMNLTIIVQ
jgi:plastocyanin